MAGHCGMSLTEVQQKHTYRQYLAFLEWRAAKLNRPDLTQMYLMQIARMVNLQRAPEEEWERNPLKNYRLQFGDSEPEEEFTEEEQQMRIQISKGAWGSRVGLRVAPQSLEGLEPSSGTSEGGSS